MPRLRPSSRLIALTAFVLGGLLAIFLFRPKPTPEPPPPPPTALDTFTAPPPAAPPTAPALTAPPLTPRPTPPVASTSPTSSTTSTPLAFPPSELLLRARAGSFTPQDVTDAAAFLTDRERVEFLFARYEKLSAPLAPASKPAKTRRHTSIQP